MKPNPDEYIVSNPLGFGGAIRWFRHEREMTQAELARRARMHVPRLSDMEQGKVTRQMESLVRLCQVLDVEIVIRMAHGGQNR